MTLESIIGITSGIIGIISAGIAIFRYFQKQPANELFAKLADKTLSQKEHQNVLKKLDKILLLKCGKGIKSEYINNFSNNNRGKETIFRDLCLQNELEPTTELCKDLCGCDCPSFRKEYFEKKSQSTSQKLHNTPLHQNNMESVPTPNITTSTKQIVYVSELLKTKFPECFGRLTSILDKHNIKYALIKGTKDIWCRDYMPIQIESGKLIQFRYDPSYLKGNKEWEESRSDVKEVCKLNNFDVTFSDINIDGGNVLICEGRAILSDRIFSENPELKQEELLAKLSDLLECEIIIIPAQNGDYTGHADGMVRFVNRNTILGNKLEDEYKYWQKGMQKVIECYNLKYIDMPFITDIKVPNHPGSAAGIYVNYLELDNLIVMPIYGREEDNQVFNILKKTFPDKTIETIDYNDVAYEGGVLNCSTWVYRTA